MKQKEHIIKSVLINYKPRLVITNTSRGVDGLICENASKLSIKTLCISHGTVSKGFNFFDRVYHKNMSEELISNFHSYFCSQSKIARDFIKSINYKNKNFNSEI